MKTILLSSIVVLLTLCSCRENKTKVTEGSNPFVRNFNSQTKNEKILPKDSSFYFNGITSSEIVEKSINSFDYLFVDSTKDKSYLKLDNTLKLKLLPNIVNKDSSWLVNDIQAFLISKQEKIGNIQPIIVQTFGTDFEALTLLNLDENGNLIFGKCLYGGENSGPLYESDSLVVCRPYTRCFFNKNLINSYSLFPEINNPKDNDIATIDSINYESTIDPDGSIKTRQLDSYKYKRVYKW